jgi:hypothetical protein
VDSADSGARFQEDPLCVLASAGVGARTGWSDPVRHTGSNDGSDGAGLGSSAGMDGASLNYLVAEVACARPLGPVSRSRKLSTIAKAMQASQNQAPD